MGLDFVVGLREWVRFYGRFTGMGLDFVSGLREWG